MEILKVSDAKILVNLFVENEVVNKIELTVHGELIPPHEQFTNAIYKYLKGKIKNLSLPHNKALITPFQKKVLDVIKNIPYAHTVAYSDIAQTLGNKNLARAVGNALNKNPFPLIYPCHRVVGKHSFGGFSKGVFLKRYLLSLEEKYI